jgi:hypothetical protein
MEGFMGNTGGGYTNTLRALTTTPICESFTGRSI